MSSGPQEGVPHIKQIGLLKVELCKIRSNLHSMPLLPVSFWRGHKQ